MHFETFKTEYLIIIDTKDSFCDNKVAFNNLIQTNSQINIQNDRLTFKDLTVEYVLQTEEMNHESQRYFHLKIGTNEIDKLETFEQLLKIIRVICSKVSKYQIQTIWDDVSFYYANKAYPIIHEIENLMRKLITKFMLTNVGVGWTKTSMPSKVIDSMKKKGKAKSEHSLDYLYETDFIQLANFLFEPYQTDDPNNLIEKIKVVKEINDLTLEELKSYVSKSNWERYFSKIVLCEHEYLKKRWEILYDLRCKIAHNNKMNREDYNKTETIVLELKDKLQSAIDNLDKISITVEEKEDIAESMVINNHEAFGKFIYTYKQLEEELYNYSVKLGLELGHRGRQSSLIIIRGLYDKGLINKEIHNKLESIRKVRNSLVHDNEVYDISVLDNLISEMMIFINLLKEGSFNLQDENNLCSKCGKLSIEDLTDDEPICKDCLNTEQE
ncbi:MULTISPECIES: HEPN domain-containing protein [Bacillus]|uniref:HEPN domain-containing protein n=1 Tax=Bacillus TaxID=1386 RepID=UPI001063FC7A|nr:MULTISPECIES: HEPN domain-containing protein [Bacillus]NYS75873.1 hypothetical protein [Bacillus sp. BH32]TKH62593.1 hypothetical protein FC677_00440 [Bacillus cereus]